MESCAFQGPRASIVVRRLPCVLHAVDLDDVPRSMATEIHDIAIDRNLSFEFGAAKTRAAQPRPEYAFCRGPRVTQAASETMRFGGCVG